MGNNYFWISLFALMSLTCITHAAALNKDQPVTIEANSAQLDDKNGTSIYSGNVIIVQGSLRISADKVTAYQEKNAIGKIVADGSPARYDQAGATKDDHVTALANTIDYIANDDKIILKGNAKLEQKGNTVEGQLITYDIKRKIGNAGSNKSTSKTENGRVKMIFQPKSSPTSKPTTEANKP